MENWFAMLLLVLRGSRNIYLNNTTLLSTIFAPFSIREGLKKKKCYTWAFGRSQEGAVGPNLLSGQFYNAYEG